LSIYFFESPPGKNFYPAKENLNRKFFHKIYFKNLTVMEVPPRLEVEGGASVAFFSVWSSADNKRLLENILRFFYGNGALEVCNLTLSVDGKSILNDFSLAIPTGEIHVLMGKNGMGKSSLAKTIAGHSDYAISQGKIIFHGEDITQLPPEE
jgi:ABC-type multidrug transport system fused ATPase/permease subunit